jgi:hypothetical protein
MLHEDTIYDAASYKSWALRSGPPLGDRVPRIGALYGPERDLPEKTTMPALEGGPLG